jgi:hypothetical protein
VAFTCQRRARIVAAVLEKEPETALQRHQPHRRLGRGESFGDRHSSTDGYTLGIITVEISMMHWQGLTELKPNSCTPLALMNEDPPGVARPFLNFACASSTTSLADASPR